MCRGRPTGDVNTAIKVWFVASLTKSGNYRAKDGECGTRAVDVGDALDGSNVSALPSGDLVRRQSRVISFVHEASGISSDLSDFTDEFSESSVETRGKINQR